MNFENQIPVRKTAEEKAHEKKRQEGQKVEGVLARIFDSSNNPEERLNYFEAELQKFSESCGGLINEVEINQVREGIKDLCNTGDREDFIKHGALALQPLMDWKEANKELVEAKQRADFVEQGNFIPLNESLSYGKTGDTVHIHVAPSETLSAGSKLVLLRNGLRELKKIVAEDETIKKITATSWIVVTEQGRGIMEKLGFTVTGEVPQKLRERFFKSEERPVSEALITRDEFLGRKI